MDAIHYVDGHICKGKPREAHTFYMVPLDPATQHFRGDLKMTINTVYHELSGAQSLPAITASENGEYPKGIVYRQDYAKSGITTFLDSMSSKLN